MHSELEQVSQAWLKAWLAKDAAAIEALAAPEYKYVAPNGQVLDRERILAIVRSSSYRLDRATRSEVHITRFRDSAILLGRVQSSGSFDGKAFTDDHRCSAVWLRRRRTWQLAWEHCSPLAP